MARTCGTSGAETAVVWLSLRFRFLGFEVRIWRAPECPRITLPVAVNLKRLAAPLCVFNFSLAFSRSSSWKKSKVKESKVEEREPSTFYSDRAYGLGVTGAAAGADAPAAGPALPAAGVLATAGDAGFPLGAAGFGGLAP